MNFLGIHETKAQITKSLIKSKLLRQAFVISQSTNGFFDLSPDLFLKKTTI